MLFTLFCAGGNLTVKCDFFQMYVLNFDIFLLLFFFFFVKSGQLQCFDDSISNARIQ